MTNGSKKLTGREAVIAIMQGKKITREEDEIWLNPGAVELDTNKTSQKHKYLSFAEILAYDDWEIVIEPRVWEGECEGRVDALVLGWSGPTMPDWMHEKKFKVRAEEIL
jgi:hypothetical protein